jgi:hypothetical protein
VNSRHDRHPQVYNAPVRLDPEAAIRGTRLGMPSSASTFRREMPLGDLVPLTEVA